MTMTERRLSEGLHYLAEPVPSEVDIDQVLVRGDALRQRRRAGWVAGAGALVLGLVAAVPLTGIFPRGHGQVTIMATPEPVQSAVMAAPTPTPTTAPSSASSVGAGASAEFRLVGRKGQPDHGLDAVVVRGERAGSDFRVEVATRRKNGTEAQPSSVRFGSDGQAVIKLSDQLWVLLLPTQPELLWVMPAVDDGGMATTSTHHVPGIPVAATLVESESEQVDLAGLLWLDSAGTVRDTEGRVVPSAKFAIANRDFFYVQDEGLGLACGGEWTGRVAKALECGSLASWQHGRGDQTIVAGGGASTTDEGYESQYFVVLPEGSKEGIEVDDDGTASCQAVQGSYGDTDRFAYLVLCQRSTMNEPGFSAVHYRNANGQPVTYRQ